MKHYWMVLLCCLGLVLSRAPMSFEDLWNIQNGGEYGTASAYDCSCYSYDNYCIVSGGADAGVDPWVRPTDYCLCINYGTNECSTPPDDGSGLGGGTDPGAGGGDGGSGGGSGSGGGLTPEQLQAIAAVIAALQNAESAANGAAGNLATLNSLYASLSNLQAALADSRGQVSSSIATINNSLALVTGYLRQGEALGPQALEMIELQVATAVLQRAFADEDNKNTQGSTTGDPVLIASGFESYKAEDLNYKAVSDLITISRQFRSNQTELKSSFGRSWFFNYDTNIVAGRKPLIKEREILTEDLRQQAEQLAGLAASAA
ncbi:MAG: hypothetical protein ACD_75C01288G0001, partial [uncultured bacterium]